LALLFTSVAAAISAWALRRTCGLAISVAVGFFAGGLLLGSVEWRRAWRPPLRLAFENLARAERAQAEAEGRRLPEDDEAFATVEGVLRADGSPSESGVSLSVDIDRIFVAGAKSVGAGLVPAPGATSERTRGGI